jgi:protein phosphatase
MLRVSSAVASHRGLRRDENEDAHCVRPDLGLYLIADGMGGHAAGEVASKTVVEAVEQFVSETAGHDPNAGSWPYPYDPALTRDGNRLTMAFRLANRRISHAASEDEALRGMATTAAAVLFDGEAGVVAHVGDSRVYRWRGRALEQLTEDHSWVREQVRAGALSEADAHRHPWRNVVTRALTGGADPQVDVANLEVRSGDRLLLCSDGLSSVVPAETIAKALGAGRSLDDTCRMLVDAANAAGGPDNITVAVVQLDVE